MSAEAATLTRYSAIPPGLKPLLLLVGVASVMAAGMFIGDSEAAQRETEFEMAQRLEEDYSRRIESLLTPFFGRGRVRAQVVAQLDSSVIEAAREQYPPGSQRESSRNYEIDRTLTYTRQPSGRLQKLTVAVLVDNLRTTDKEGKVKETPLTEQQLALMTTLVKDGIGFNAERGDSVNVVNSSFLKEPIVAEGDVKQVPLWERPLTRDIAKWAAGLSGVVLLVFMVIRPLVRGLLTQSGETPLAAVQAEAPARATSSASSQPSAYEQQLTQARTLVSQDPKRVAQVVRTMIAKDA